MAEMKHHSWLNLGLFWLLLGICASADAFHVLSYELRVGQGGTEKYTALVMLPDYFERHFGEPDAFSTILAQSPAPDLGFWNDYQSRVREWYLASLARETRVYGPNVDNIVEHLRHAQPIDLNQSAVIVITRHGEINKPLAMLTVGNSGPDGGRLLPIEDTFLRSPEGIQERLPQTEPTFSWATISDYKAQLFQGRFIEFSFPLPQREHFWLEGENVELKTFALDPELAPKLFRHLFFLLSTHKLSHFGAGLFPKETLHWPNGVSIPDVAKGRWARRVSDIWIYAVGDLMKRYYERLGFKVWRSTQGPPPFGSGYILRTTPSVLHSRLESIVRAENIAGSGHYLVYRRELAKRLSASTCASQILLRTPN